MQICAHTRFFNIPECASKPPKEKISQLLISCRWEIAFLVTCWNKFILRVQCACRIFLWDASNLRKGLQWEPVSVGAGVGFESDFLIAEFGMRREGQASGSGEYI